MKETFSYIRFSISTPFGMTTVKMEGDYIESAIAKMRNDGYALAEDGQIYPWHAIKCIGEIRKFSVTKEVPDEEDAE
jgi:hypothetical protein